MTEIQVLNNLVRVIDEGNSLLYLFLNATLNPIIDISIELLIVPEVFSEGAT